MKIQIDTKAKTIKIDNTVNLGELYEVLDKFLPKEWKNYSLETESIILWKDPITINPWVYPVFPTNPYPWWHQPPIVTCDTNTIGETSKSSVYNIDVSNFIKLE